MDNKHNLHIRPISELHPSVLSLIGVARRKGEQEIQDINGRDIVAEQLEEEWKRLHE